MRGRGRTAQAWIVVYVSYVVGMKVLPTKLQYRGKISIDSYPALGNPCGTLLPSERWDLWDVGTVYGRSLLPYPPRFITWGTREIFKKKVRGTRASISTIKDKVRGEIRTHACPTNDVKCEGAAYRAIIGGKNFERLCPAQGNP